MTVLTFVFVDWHGSLELLSDYFDLFQGGQRRGGARTALPNRAGYGGIRNPIRVLVVVTAPTSSRLTFRVAATASTVSTIIAGSVGRFSNGPPCGHGPSVSSNMRPKGTIFARRLSRVRYATSGVSEMK